MEVDTESTNTSVEDKTEDFCDNPTRDALTEGLMRLFKSTIDKLDEKVRTIRISQVELRQQIEGLSDELKKINESSSDKDIDLDVYVKKLMSVKHKITVVSNILQSSEERLLKLQRNINRDSISMKALLDTSSVSHVSQMEPDDSLIQAQFTCINFIYIMEYTKKNECKINTPTLFHTTYKDWEFVYEPAEDTFLLIDALENDINFIINRKPGICLEVGSGSGIIITALKKTLGSISHCLAIDVNQFACHLTKRTSDHNFVFVDVMKGNLTSCIRKSVVDLILFNPPYVVTTSEELNSCDYLTRSWAGGRNGREVIDQFLNGLCDVLAPNGFGYILLLKENNPQEVTDIMSEQNFKAFIMSCRKLRGEELYIVKFEKNG